VLPSESDYANLGRGLLLLALLGALIGAGRRLHELSVRWRDPILRRQDLPVALAVLAGLLLRLGAWASPHDVNDRLRAVWLMRPSQGFGYYGLGMPTWAESLVTVFGRQQAVILHSNAALGALSIALLATWMHSFGASPRARAWAAWACALTPLLIRFSHTDVQTIPEIALVLLALVSLERSRDLGRLDAVLAGCCLGAATHFRPEAPLLTAAIAAWPLVRGMPGAWWRQRGLPFVATTAAITAPWAVAILLRLQAVHAGELPTPLPMGNSPHALIKHGWRHLVTLDPAFTSPLAAASMFGGLLARGTPRGIRLWMGLLILCFSVLNPVDAWTSAGGEGLLLARYQLRVLPFAAALTGLAIDALLGARPALRWPVRVLMALGWCAVLPVAYTPTLVDTEHAFFHEALPEVPEGCEIWTLRIGMDATLVPERFESRLAGQEHRWRDLRDGHEPIGDGACVVWYRSGQCWADVPPHDGTPDTLQPGCARFEQRHPLQPLRVTALEGAPPLYEDLTTSRPEVGFFWVRQP
jgi:hypothetical protein